MKKEERAGAEQKKREGKEVARTIH